jgi:hypothetical protein
MASESNAALMMFCSAESISVRHPVIAMAGLAMASARFVCAMMRPRFTAHRYAGVNMYRNASNYIVIV